MIHEHFAKFLSTAVCGLLVLAALPAAAGVVDGIVIINQRMGENLCALTFDDGPSCFTPHLLDLLNDYGIPATFFLVGSMAKKSPHIVRRMVAEGHEVGNHTWSHPNLRRISRERKLKEILRTNDLLTSLGAQPTCLRPPYGAFDDYTVEVANSLGLSVVLWSVDTRDWRRLPASYAALRNGRGTVYPQGKMRGIFLFHDTHKNTVEDLPRIVKELYEAGCSRFVTASEYLDGLLDPEPGMLMTRRRPADADAAVPPSPRAPAELMHTGFVERPGNRPE
ncbi:MAG: polysaccharide deacetylase family protein [Desulfovibrio sp.]|jgi:peptidoglycan/xylan/chitin deacetylase (PgdA/CDA1 family)|nr:polysaccharide deacetylase family protein [Desulfovibrio sp.]